MNQEGRNHISLFVAKEILSADKHKKPLITTSELDIKNACLPLKVSTRSTADNKKKKSNKSISSSHELRRCNGHENKPNAFEEIKLNVMDHGTEALAA